jgi:hypothetical protein
MKVVLVQRKCKKDMIRESICVETEMRIIKSESRLQISLIYH